MRCVLVLAIVHLTSSISAAPTEGEAFPGLEFDPDELALLPIDHHEWAVLYQEHRALIDMLYGLRWHRQQIEKKGDRETWDEVRWRALDARARAAHAKLAELLPNVDAELLQLAASTPDGPRKNERYAHRVLLEYGMLSAKQRTLLQQVVVAVETAQRCAEETQAKLREAGQPELAESMVPSIWSLERQLWRVVDLTLNEHQRSAVRERLPRSMQFVDDLRGHLLALPDLQPAQAARLQALVAEWDSEASPDRALTRRLQKEVNDPSVPEEERAELRKELSAGYTRLNRLHHETIAAARKVLSESQWLALSAVPPRVYPGDRQQSPENLLTNLDFTSGQLDEIAVLEMRYQELLRARNRAQAELEAKREELGGDSPQMAVGSMMRDSEMRSARRDLEHVLRQVFLDVLTPEQVIDWTLRL